MVEKCSKCEKPAIGRCAQCGKLLCEDHSHHGISMRTNAPVISCQGCEKNTRNQLKLVGFLMSIGLIIAIIILIAWLSTRIPF